MTLQRQRRRVAARLAAAERELRAAVHAQDGSPVSRTRYKKALDERDLAEAEARVFFVLDSASHENRAAQHDARAAASTEKSG